MNLNELPDMTEALKQVIEGQKNKKEPRWQDDDGDGKWYEKSDVDGKISKREKKSKKHNCASKVKHEEFGVGNCIKGMHDLNESGEVEHYDVFFEHGIEKNVPVSSLEILEGHMHEHVIHEGKKNCGCGQDPCITYGKGKNAHKMPDGTVMPGKTHKEEVEELEGEQLDEISADLALKASKAADVKRGKLAVAGDRKGAASKSAQAVRLYKKQAAKRKQETKEEVERTEGKKFREAFAFSNDEWQDLAEKGRFIDDLTEEELVDFMEVCILETAQDDNDLSEICEQLELVELNEAYFIEGGSYEKGGKVEPSRLERMKSAAKKAASKVKSGVKKLAKKGAQAAGKTVGEFQAAREKQKKKALSRKEDPKKKDDKEEDDGTGGKLDKLLASARGKTNDGDSDSSSSSNSSSSSSETRSSSSGGSSSGSTRKAVGGALKSVGRLIKKGLKKAVGKTARAVSKGSNKLAKRLGEHYDEIEGLVESGLFTIEEIENVLELNAKMKKEKK
jgi:hypothetical protein